MTDQVFKHDASTCPRCGKIFECKPGDIAHCGCNAFRIPENVSQKIAETYPGCLCPACLEELSKATA